MAPVRAVWGYPPTHTHTHTISKPSTRCTDGIMACNSDDYTRSSGDRNKGGSEGTLFAALVNSTATADVNNNESDNIRPIELNDFRKYPHVYAV